MNKIKIAALFLVSSLVNVTYASTEKVELMRNNILTHTQSESSVSLTRWENSTISIDLQSNCWFGDVFLSGGKTQCETAMLFDAKDDNSVLKVMNGLADPVSIHMLYEPGFKDFIQAGEFNITLEVPTFNANLEKVGTKLVTYSLPNFSQILEENKSAAHEAAISRIKKDRTTLVISALLLLLLVSFIVRILVKWLKR